MLTVLVTGASSGIGAATALHLDRAGHRVFAGVEDPTDGADALAAASPTLQRVVLDVCSQDSIGEAVNRISGALQGAGLDGVVNNAGIALAGPLEVLPIDDLRRQMETNVIGQVAVTQATLPLIRAAGGRVVLMSSIGGRVASQFAGAYYASKHALEAIGEALRQELDPEGIPVVLIEPSIISTPIWDKGIAFLDALRGRLDAEQRARYGERLDAFRDSLRSADEHGHDPEDVAEVVAEALTTDKPDTRYVVGADGKLVTALRPFIPDRIADKLAERTAQP
jgi:NAD(P)-dependent dehydrogenase (short-subunit alcohol dehydrogenase family)